MKPCDKIMVKNPFGQRHLRWLLLSLGMTTMIAGCSSKGIGIPTDKPSKAVTSGYTKLATELNYPFSRERVVPSNYMLGELQPSILQRKQVALTQLETNDFLVNESRMMALDAISRMIYIKHTQESKGDGSGKLLGYLAIGLISGGTAAAGAVVADVFSESGAGIEDDVSKVQKDYEFVRSRLPVIAAVHAGSKKLDPMFSIDFDESFLDSETNEYFALTNDTNKSLTNITLEVIAIRSTGQKREYVRFVEFWKPDETRYLHIPVLKETGLFAGNSRDYHESITVSAFCDQGRIEGAKYVYTPEERRNDYSQFLQENLLIKYSYKQESASGLFWYTPEVKFHLSGVDRLPAYNLKVSFYATMPEGARKQFVHEVSSVRWEAYEVNSKRLPEGAILEKDTLEIRLEIPSAQFVYTRKLADAVISADTK